MRHVGSMILCLLEDIFINKKQQICQEEKDAVMKHLQRLWEADHPGETINFKDLLKWTLEHSLQISNPYEHIEKIKWYFKEFRSSRHLVPEYLQEQYWYETGFLTNGFQLQNAQYYEILLKNQ